MNKVNVLIEGYAKELKNGWKASSTTTLIQTDNLNILCDPGINYPLLSKKLKKKNLKPNDIDWIFLSHTHIDHSYNMAYFPQAKVIDLETIYDKDDEYDHGGKIPSTDLKIIPTPGHALEHCSLVIPTNKGVYVVAADAFWWTNNEDQKTDKESLLSKDDPFTVDKKDLLQSRQKVLKLADYIIPGHGKMFEVEK